MRVLRRSPDPLARMHIITKRQGKSGTIDVKALLAGDEEFLRALVRTALQEVLEAEMTAALGAEKGERSGPTGSSVGRLPPDADHPARQARAAGAAGARRAVLDRAVGALPALGAGAGGGVGGDLGAGVSTRKSLPPRRRGSRRSPRSCAATASRPPRSVRSISG